MTTYDYICLHIFITQYENVNIWKNIPIATMKHVRNQIVVTLLEIYQNVLTLEKYAVLVDVKR